MPLHIIPSLLGRQETNPIGSPAAVSPNTLNTMLSPNTLLHGLEDTAAVSLLDFVAHTTAARGSDNTNKAKRVNGKDHDDRLNACKEGSADSRRGRGAISYADQSTSQTTR